MPDRTCVIFEDGKVEHLEVSLPMRVLYHGKVYLLAVSNGQRQGLILTKHERGETPPDDPQKK